MLFGGRILLESFKTALQKDLQSQQKQKTQSLTKHKLCSIRLYKQNIVQGYSGWHKAE